MEKKEFNKVLLSKVSPRLKKLYETSDKIIRYFNRNNSHPEMITVSVLLQNAMMSKDIDDIKEQSSLIKDMSIYLDIHIISWIAKEMYFIISGEEMALEMMLENM